MIHVELYDRNRNRIPDTLSYEVQQYDADAIGGPQTATFAVSGEGVDRVRSWLGYYVIFRNGAGTPVWWGKVRSVTVDINGLLIDLSVDDIYNRVQVLYTVIDGDGYAIAAQTDWVEDARSIDVYGRHELRHSIGEATPQMALKSAQRLLAKFKLPGQQIGLGRSSGATVRCEGLWPTLSQTYLLRDTGREVFTTPDNADQPFGWGVVTTVTGFASGAIQRLAGGLEVFKVGDKVTVAGGSNAGVKTVASSATGDVRTYTATTIEFDPEDDINDSAEGMSFVRAGAFIRITGSVGNSGWHLVNTAARDHLTTDTTVGGAIVDEAAGPAITIEHGQMLAVSEALTTEAPGNSITLTGYTGLAYSFVPSGAGGWRASEIWVRLRRIGTPDDSVRVLLHANLNGKPGTLLDSATVAATDLFERTAWVQFNMPNGAILSSNTIYWIVIERTGTNRVDAYYSVGLDETVGHSGTALVRSNGLWINRPKAASMPFQVWGHTETTAQILSILQTESQYTSGISVRAASGIPQRTYRDGATDALSTLVSLLDAGTVADQTLLATVTADWRVVVETAPTGDPVYILRKGPRFGLIAGGEIGEGVLPVGQWVAVDGVGEVDAIAPLSPFLLGYADYSVGRGGIGTMRAYGTSSAFDFAKIAQG